MSDEGSTWDDETAGWHGLVNELVAILLGAGLPASQMPRLSIHFGEHEGPLRIGYDGVPEGGPQASDGRPSWAHLVEAAARTISVRSARHRPDSIRFYPENWRETLRRIWDPWLDCEVSIDQGWADLIVAMLGHVDEAEPDEFNFRQIKEKFGGLRLYASATTDEVQEILSAYEALSYHICETCGAPGELRQDGWWRTLCDRHAEDER